MTDGQYDQPTKNNFRCGNESVVAYWERDNTLFIVGKHGQKMMYTYDSSVYLTAEIDGIRILSNTQHELLQKVPDVVQKIFRINSTDPGSFLLEASKHYQVSSLFLYYQRWYEKSPNCRNGVTAPTSTSVLSNKILRKPWNSVLMPWGMNLTLKYRKC
mgnify:CR=1 FL=1